MWKNVKNNYLGLVTKNNNKGIGDGFNAKPFSISIELKPRYIIL